MRRAAGWMTAGMAALLTVPAWIPGDSARLDAATAALPLAPVIALGAIVIGGRGRSTAIAILALLASGWLIAAEWLGGAGEAPKDATRRALVIVTHNVGSANRDPAGTMAALAASGADVLLLQETDGTFAPYLRQLRARYPFGDPCRWRCALAILSRWPIERARWRFRDEAGRPFGPDLFQTRLILPWGGTAGIATLHLSRTASVERRTAERRSLAAAARRMADTALVIAGDLNLTPWGGAMRALDAGVAPLERATRATFSYPATWRGTTAPLPLLPIDHLYAGPAWSVAAVRRLPKTGSDHYPIRVNLVWRGQSL